MIVWGFSLIYFVILIDNFRVMEENNENKKETNLNEPQVNYPQPKLKKQGVNRETFDFDAEFAKGLTSEEAREESLRKIRLWRKK